MKKIYQKIFLLGLISTMGFLSSCEKEYFVPVKSDPSVPVSYSSDMQPFFDASCAITGCHISGFSWGDFTSPGSYDIVRNNYVNIADPESSKLYTKIAPGGTMENFSTPGNTAMVLQWIEEGALNN